MTYIRRFRLKLKNQNVKIILVSQKLTLQSPCNRHRSSLVKLSKLLASARKSTPWMNALSISLVSAHAESIALSLQQLGESGSARPVRKKIIRGDALAPRGNAPRQSCSHYMYTPHHESAVHRAARWVQNARAIPKEQRYLRAHCYFWG